MEYVHDNIYTTLKSKDLSYDFVVARLDNGNMLFRRIGVLGGNVYRNVVRISVGIDDLLIDGYDEDSN